MGVNKIRRHLADFIERESLLPDLNRAIRAVIAFMVPLLATHFGWIHLDPIHACIAAQTIAQVDVRGVYSLRLGLLLAVTLILTGSVFVGTLGEIGLPFALLGTAIVVGAGGLWRHLSSEYGPGLAVSSGLLFFISLAGPVSVGPVSNGHPVFATLIGGLFGVLLQVAFWPFHPQHPLRRVVAESWMALGDLLEAISPDKTEQREKMIDREVNLRAKLNQSQAILHASKRHPGDFLKHLEALNIAAARLGLRIIAFRTALETVSNQAGYQRLEPVFAPALTSLTNTARMVALAVVSRQPSHWTAFEVRLTRLENLLAIVRSQVKSQLDDPVAGEQFADIIRQIEEQLPMVRRSLRATMDRVNERAAFSMELFDLGTLTLRPLAASLNLNGQFDPSLVRHTMRAVILALGGVAFFIQSGFSHGYWLPFTMLVVLQPDFGSTREKAAQRVVGTLAGGLIASSLLWLHPPAAVLLVAIAITIALFAYYLKRNYAVAVVFITLMVVLLTEAQHPVTLAFTLERMASTLLGGMLALAAAFLFWPAWERGRFPAIMAAALRKNGEYLQMTLDRLRNGGVQDDAILRVRQAAESANSEAFSSLRRMIADPKNQQRGLEQAGALANGNQRVARALSVITLHLDGEKTRHAETVEQFSRLCGVAFEALIFCEQTGRPPADIGEVLTGLKNFRLPEIQRGEADPAHFREPWTYPQLGRIVTELSAMLRMISKEKKPESPDRAGS
jgi:uncharacterized membrane protein YccC